MLLERLSKIRSRAAILIIEITPTLRAGPKVVATCINAAILGPSRGRAGKITVIQNCSISCVHSSVESDYHNAVHCFAIFFCFAFLWSTSQ